MNNKKHKSGKADVRVCHVIVIEGPKTYCLAYGTCKRKSLLSKGKKV